MNELIFYPDPRLKQVSLPVEDFEEIKKTADLLQLLIFKNQARGLAAIQVSKPSRMFAILMDKQQEEVRIFCNPEIIEFRGKPQTSMEGCLSIPGVIGKIQRYPEVVVKAQDTNGAEFILQLKDHLAVAMQHEYDHLDGILMWNRMGSAQRTLKRNSYLKRRKKENAKR